MVHSFSFWTLALILMILNGCFGGRIQDTRYYLLDYIPQVDSARTPHDVSLRIREFSIAEAYRKPQIVYRQSPHELQYYNYHQWAIKPERLVSEVIANHWTASRVFRNVQTESQDREADYILDGMIEAIEEYDNANKWYAHLAMRYQLIHSESGQKIWSERYDFRTPVQNQQPVQVVRALSALLESTNRRAIAAVDSLITLRKSQ
jgi:ABC-type uncharacterized transport system auxiliary subunit